MSSNTDKVKTGPKKAYAVDKIMSRLTDEEKIALRKTIYIDRLSKKALASKIGLSYPLINDFIEKLGMLQPEDLTP